MFGDDEYIVIMGGWEKVDPTPGRLFIECMLIYHIVTYVFGSLCVGSVKYCRARRKAG